MKTNEEKAREIADCKHCYFRNNCGVSCDELNHIVEMAKLKDEQNRINNAHLKLLYDALDRLYKKKYGDNWILETGSQTDVYLQMIDNLIKEE